MATQDCVGGGVSMETTGPIIIIEAPDATFADAKQAILNRLVAVAGRTDPTLRQDGAEVVNLATALATVVGAEAAALRNADANLNSAANTARPAGVQSGNANHRERPYGGGPSGVSDRDRGL